MHNQWAEAHVVHVLIVCISDATGPKFSQNKTFVHGLPINAYCDQLWLANHYRSRGGLFVLAMNYFSHDDGYIFK